MLAEQNNCRPYIFFGRYEAYFFIFFSKISKVSQRKESVDMNTSVIWEKEELAILKKNACIIHTLTNHILFKENDETDNVYFIEKGHIRHYHNTARGKMAIVSICGPNEIIGIPAILLRQKRGVYAETIDESTLWAIPQRDFFNILYQHPQLTLKIMAIYCQYVRNYEYSIEGLLAADVSARLAWLLIHIASTAREKGRLRHFIDFRITHQEMADMIGACRQTVTVVLGHFQENGWVRVSKNLIEIMGIEELKKLAG